MGFLLFSGGALGLPAHAAAPEVPAQPSYAVTLTAYNAVPSQTDSDPLVTASGAFSNPEVVMARSQDLRSKLPFGTIVEVHGPSDRQNNCGYGVVAPLIGYRVIADVMNARYTDRADVLFSTKSNYTMADGSSINAGTILGDCTGVTIRVVGYIDITNPNRLPKTQAELEKIVHGTSDALALKSK